MQEEKRKKTIKISLIVLFALVVVAIIAMLISSAIIKKDTQDLQQENSQIEEVLQNSQPEQF